MEQFFPLWDTYPWWGKIIVAGSCAMTLTFFLVGIVFWVWMFLDCYLNEDEHQVGWLMLIISLSVPGAAVYFVVRKIKRPSKAAVAVPITIRRVEVVKDGFSVEFSNGETENCRWSRFPKLASASESDRQKCEVTASKHSIHWPALDYYLAVDELLPK